VKITLESKVTELSGCGKKRSELLSLMGIENVGQLLRHFPRGYQNRGDVKALSDESVGETGAFILTVSGSAQTARISGGRTLTKCRAFDGDKSCTLVFFNRNYIKDVLVTGCTYRFWGKLIRGKTGYELSPSTIEPVTDNVKLREFIPLYPLRAGLTQKFISSLILSALDQIEPSEIRDALPESVREALDICTEYEAYRYIHDPSSTDMIEKGRFRFIAEELFSFACSVTMANEGRRNLIGKRIDPERSKFYDFTAALPFKLTAAQAKVISEIRKDMTSDSPMARLVSGDVGSGKTVCAMAAAFIAVRNGYQAAMMAPTEILALQHYKDFNEILGKLGIKCGYLSGSVTAAKRREILYGLESGEIKFVVGTHALISQGVKYNNLGLVITDEQHRFGVMQRAVLSQKAVSPHVLVMSATPIPRTLALILCGDLDISVIDELPPGRQPVDTLVIGEKHRKRMYGFIEKEILAGRQVYIVCPSVEAQEEEEEVPEEEFLRFDFDKNPERMPKLKSAIDYEKRLREDVFPQFKTAFLHGRMSGKEKDAVMSEFAAGRIDILVSTTVIEVGVNVPNATLMIVENAERFGMSQLHQLRGRVGRGSEKSYCILVSDSKTETAMKRLEIMKTVSDGYKIAKYDLELRGPGDFISLNSQNARQHGALNFRMAGLCTDTQMLEKAFREAVKLIKSDPMLEKEEHAELKKAVGTVTGLTAATLS